MPTSGGQTGHCPQPCPTRAHTQGVLCPQCLGIPHVQKRKSSQALSGRDVIPGGCWEGLGAWGLPEALAEHL